MNAIVTYLFCIKHILAAASQENSPQVGPSVMEPSDLMKRGDREMTLEMIGYMRGITRERVRAILHNLVTKLLRDHHPINHN